MPADGPLDKKGDTFHFQKAVFWKLIPIYRKTSWEKERHTLSGPVSKPLQSLRIKNYNGGLNN